MKLEIKLTNSLSELDTLHRALQQMAKKEWAISDHLVKQTNLILDELVTNIIMHGDNKKECLIEIKIEKTNDTLNIKVSDDGPPFDPTLCPAPDTSEDLSHKDIGGLGIFIAKKLCDCCNYKRLNNTNIFSLQKTLK